MIHVIPRRPLDDDDPTGYRESDQDYVLNNLDAAVYLLDREIEPKSADRVETIARALYDALTADGMTAYNFDEATLECHIDGTVDCRELARAVEDKLRIEAAATIRLPRETLGEIEQGLRKIGSAAEAVGKAADDVSALDTGPARRAMSSWHAASWASLLRMIFGNR